MRIIAAAIACLAFAGQTHAQTIARFSRADLAEVYIDLERTLRAHPAGPHAAEINKLFDDATLKFFTGQRATEGLREIADRLRFGDAVTPNHAFASSLRVSARPAVMNLARPEPVRISVDPMYEAQPVGAVGVRIMAPTGKIVFETTTTEPRAEFTVEARAFGVGTYRLQVMSGEEPRFTARLVVTERSLDSVREELLKELAGVDKPVQALAACRARIGLLTDSPSFEDSSQFLAEPISLRQDLEREVAEIKAGRDPYRMKRGDYWRVFAYSGVDIAARVIVPSAGDGPFPLVMALHGAGGDENMWPDGYGAGELKALAEKRGFIVVSTRTEMLMGNAVVFDAIVNAAAEIYPIDRSRIFIIGHSLGAMAGTGIAAQRTGSVAAACLIAGMGRFPSGSKMPPTLVISGELDPLMKKDQVEAGVAAAKAAGLPVELRLIKDRGHSLLVGEELPGAIEWLLRHKS